MGVGSVFGESKILHIDHLFLLVVCVLGSVKMPKYRKKGAGIPRIENVVLYKNRIGDSGAEAFAEGKKKKMSLDRVLCFSVGRGWSTDASVVLFVVVVACSIADQQKHPNDSFVPQHDYDHGIQSLVCGGQITKDRGPH